MTEPESDLEAEPRASPVPATAAAGRLAYLDAAKVVAMCAVVAIHIYGVSYTTREPESPGWWLANLLYTGSRWSVPMFVMASGALLLGRAPDPARFYRRRFAKILPAAAFFVPAYLVFAAVVLDTPLTPSGIAAGLASGRPYNHLYFIALIGGLYAVTPLFQAALHQASRPFIWGTAIGLLAMAIADPLLAMVAGGGLAPTLVTWWIPFAGYYVLGYALSTAALSIRPVVAYGAAAAALALGVVTAWWAVTGGGPTFAGYMENYLAVTVVLATVCLFIAFRAAAPRLARSSATLSTLASLTFGVYLVHLMVATALFMLLRPSDTSVRQFTPVYVGTVVLSFGLCAFIARIRPIRWVIGL